MSNVVADTLTLLRFFAAGTGAFSISVGQSPMFAVATMRARGFRPFLSA